MAMKEQLRIPGALLDAGFLLSCSRSFPSISHQLGLQE